MVEIPVYYTVNNVHFRPGTFVFTNIEVGVEEVRKAVCIQDDLAPISLDVINVSTGNSIVKADLVEESGGSVLQCRVKAEQMPASRIIQGNIVGRTGGSEVFNVPYVIVFRPPSQ